MVAEARVMVAETGVVGAEAGAGILGAPILMPMSLIVTILSPTSTVQTPPILLALAVVAVQPTLSSAMNSAAPSRSTLKKLPCHCGGTFPMGAAVNRSV